MNEEFLAKKISDAIQNVDSTKPESYDAPAEVLRIENQTAWVHIDGGVAETPVKLTINAKVGDTVQVRVTNGHAFIIGNVTAPPTDDSKAEEAINYAQIANNAANEAVSSAHRANEAAQDAQVDAARASTAAATAETNAQTAITNAGLAQTAADSAQTSANNALLGLSQVESVVDTLNWLTEHSNVTEDTTPVANKNYYIKNQDNTFTLVTDTTGKNPAQEGWYEMDDAISNYVASHLALTDDGLDVMMDGTKWKVRIASDGVYILDENNKAINTMNSEGNQIGYTDDFRVLVKNQEFLFVNEDNVPYIQISKGSEQTSIVKYSTGEKGRGYTSAIERTLVETLQVNHNFVDGSLKIVFSYKYSDSASYTDVTVNLSSEGSQTIGDTTITYENGLITIAHTYISNIIIYECYYEHNTTYTAPKFLFGSGSIEENGNFSAAFGRNNVASGENSFATGTNTLASGNIAHVEGNYSIASGIYSHSEGAGAEASGYAAHAEGGGVFLLDPTTQKIVVVAKTIASGICAHAEGRDTEASGNYSHAQNIGTITAGNFQTAIGKYNDNNQNNAFEIGNGSDDTNRSNALEVDWNGNFKTAGNITDGSGNVLSEKLDASLLADYVIEQGTSGNWKYRKWSSGKIEAWAKITFTYGATTAVGQLHRASISTTFPTALGLSANANVLATMGAAQSVVTVNMSVTSSGSGLTGYIFRPTSQSGSSSVAISLYVWED